MLTTNVPLSRTAVSVTAARLRQTSSEGGSSDTEETALAVAPWSVSSWREVMTVTPVAKCPMTWRYRSPSNVACAMVPAPLAEPMAPRYHQQNECVYRSVRRNEE
jgi:hypothetical protein